MAIYKVKASQLVYFTVLIEAESEAAANDQLGDIYPENCYEHSDIDWQIDSVSAASALDIERFPLFKNEA